MNCTRLQEQAAAYALDALERADAARIEALAGSDPDIRAELDAFLAIANRLALVALPVDPPPSVRAAVLARIRSTPQAASATSTAVPPVVESTPAGFQFLSSEQREWKDGAVPGLRVQVLALNPRSNYSMLQLELAPGTTYPQHVHTGNEELFVVSGDLVSEGRTLHAGDFLHSDSGTVHHDLFSPSGCRAILVTPLSSALGEAARLQLRKVGQRVLSGLGLGGKG